MSVISTGGPTAIQKNLAADKAAANDPGKQKLKKACHEMEGYFVGMLLKQMHQSAMKGGMLDQKSESATYRDMFDDSVAAEIGKRGSFGIADMLYRELSKRIDSEEAGGSGQVAIITASSPTNQTSSTGQNGQTSPTKRKETKP